MEPTNTLSAVAYSLNKELPDLNKAIEAPIDLMSDYWTPENVGECKRVFFSHIASRPVLDSQTGQVIDLECAFFIEKTQDGNLKTISNGSKRLVGVFEDENIVQGMPFLITYLGKKKNSTNNLSSATWSVKPLILKM